MALSAVWLIARDGRGPAWGRVQDQRRRARPIIDLGSKAAIMADPRSGVL